MLPMDFQLPERNNDDMCVDKVLKISRGAEWAIARGSNYVMFVDADDLVSRRLSEFVATHPHENGWYFYTGYAHRYGERWVRKHVPHHLICGTGVIVSTSLLRFAASDFCRGHIANTLAEAGMENYLTHLDVQGAPIRPLPFPGAIYVLHDDSTSEVPGGIGYRLNSPHSARPLWRRVGSWGKHTTRALRHVRPISPWLRAEYRIPREDFEQYR
jgi:hypothetical protein